MQVPSDRCILHYILATTFLMGKSTICVVVEKTLEALWRNLSPIHMPLPTEANFLKIAKDFNKRKNLPNCIGAIDVRHVRIRKPTKGGSYFYNYTKFHSITLQAVVDADARYIVIDVGGYGSQHDSTTLKASTFYQGLKKKIIKLPNDAPLPDSTTVVPYYFIGDCAYPLMKHLLKPYPGNKVTKDQAAFNKHLSSTRMVVERTFGQDCQRWRIYYRKIECQLKVTELIVQGTCILHNVIIDLEKENSSAKKEEKKMKKRKYEPLAEISEHEDDVCDESGDVYEDDDEYEDGFPVGNGYEVREKLKDYILQHHGKNRKPT